MSIRMCIHMYVHPSVCPSFTKSFFYFNKIWLAGRGRGVMHDGMQYELIQCQGHEPFKVGNQPCSKTISPAIYNGSWQLATDSQTRTPYLNLIWPDV